MQINRLFEIVYILLGRKQVRAHELAEHFEVSTRTIYRDIETLSCAGIPVYATKGKGGGIHLTENFVLNKSVLTEEEKSDVLSALQGMGATSNIASPALGKLSALFGGEQEDWIEIDFSSWNPNTSLSKYFYFLKEAILSHQCVNFNYCNARGETENRTVEPYKLIFRGYDWYLLAWCCLREDFRFFKLTRINNLSKTEAAFSRRKTPNQEPDLQSYMCNMISIKAIVSAEREYRLRDEFQESQYEKQVDGSYLLYFDMPDNSWLYDYLLTFGDSIEVVEPDEIRKKLHLIYLNAIKKYLN